jgi:hypothetical protein
MAKMIGKVRKMWYGQCKYGCCYMPHNKTAIKREEMELALREAEDELDLKHANGICYNPPGGYGCKYCYGEDLDDAYDNSDLDDIPGVWCDVDWREL